MKNKYYTPKIEEFYVGFEYEYKMMGTWDKATFDDLITTDTDGALLDYIPTENSLNSFRVKYLDKEDIEYLGFKHIGNNSFESNEDNYLSLEYFKEEKGWYLTYSENESQFGFGGWVKNKSELRKLMQQLNIL